MASADPTEHAPNPCGLLGFHILTQGIRFHEKIARARTSDAGSGLFTGRLSGMVACMFRQGILPVLMAGSLALCGCRSGRVAEIRPLMDNQLRAIFARAQDPRRLWITVYGSEEGTYFANANRLHPEQLAALSFEGGRKTGIPLVALQTDERKTYLALVDTSSRESWAAAETVQGMRGIPLGPPAYEFRPEHVQEPVRGFACAIPHLRFDVLQVQNAILYMRAATGPLGFLARRDDRPRPDLVIGTTLLDAFAFVQFNGPERRLVFSSTTDYAPSPEQLLAMLPLQRVRGAWAVDGLLDGAPAVVILDTAGDFELAMAEPPPAPLRVSLGDLVVPRVSAVGSREQGLGLLEHPRVGLKLLARFRVTFAPKRKFVYFERP